MSPSGTKSQGGNSIEERIRQLDSLLNKAQDAILVCDLNFQIYSGTKR